MAQRDFIQLQCDGEKSWWWTESLSRLKLKHPFTVCPDMTCQTAVEIMNR